MPLQYTDLMHSSSQLFLCSSALHCYLFLAVSEDRGFTIPALCLHPSTARARDMEEMLSDLRSASSSEYTEVTKGFLNSAA